MAVYYIYWIQDEVADYFYGKERKFLTLFLEKKNSAEELRKIVDKQVNYIIQEIPEMKIQQLMENAVATNTITKLSSTHYRIETNRSQYAEMEIKFPFIRIITHQCNHLEWAFFNLLRSFNGGDNEL